MVGDGLPAGRVEEIRIFPVRSLAGTPVATVAVEARGLAGDRAWAVVDDGNHVVRGKDAPEIRDVAPSGEPDADAATLTALLGRPVRLVAAAPGEEVAPVHLVSRRALARAAEGEVPEGCSADDPRANLVLGLDGDDDERAWVGRIIRVGGAVLEITRTPKHCLGVYADVRTPGEIAVGDAVLL
jgi:uncharacterized protein YcbX